MTQRIHRMPFGTQILPNGRIKFRLWAPHARTVALCLLDHLSPTYVPMLKSKGAGELSGWYEIEAELPAHNRLYCFRINDQYNVPDPVSRFQPTDIEYASQVVDPLQWEWQDEHWRGRPWEDTVIYELHVGTFTAQGDYSAIKGRLDYLLELGVTAIELMPIADFPGRRNWGYDGVLLFAPDSAYGAPDELKDLVQTAHKKGLMVFLDVVYNHFGPKGNYLPLYAPEFFTRRHHTPWGSAINYDGKHSKTVREFFIHNALYWLEEYHMDGLRFDAVHAICDDSFPDIMQEMAECVQYGPGQFRHIHLMLENDNNAAHYLRSNTKPNLKPNLKQKPGFVAQWNDDLHHILHVLLTGETGGYYQDYAENTMQHLGRCLTQGFAYQGEVSAFRDSRRRGESSDDLPSTAFVAFLQNHDQVGNRPGGERIGRLCSASSLQAVTAVLLLVPQVPLLFMGQEWNAKQPFLYFIDFDGELGAKVTAGRRREFSRFPEFNSKMRRHEIPRPNEEATFQQAILQWDDLEKADHRYWLELHRQLLSLRQKVVLPRLSGMNNGMNNGQPNYELLGQRSIKVTWTMGDLSKLTLITNLGENPQPCDWQAQGGLLYTTHPEFQQQLNLKQLKPWSVGWFLISAGD